MMIGLFNTLRVTNGGSTTYSLRHTTLAPTVTTTTINNNDRATVSVNTQTNRGALLVNTSSSDLSRVKEELHESNLENIRLRAQLEELQNDQTSTAAEQLVELQRENTELKREVAELKGQVSVLEMVNEAKANMEEADSDRDQERREQELQNQITRLEGDLNDLQEQNNALRFENHRIQELEEALGDAQGEVTGLEADVKGLTMQLNLSKANVTKQQAANKIIATKLVEMRDEIEYLKSGAGETVQIVQRQKSSDIDVEAENESLRNEIMQKVAQLDNLQNNLKNAGLQVNQLNIQITEANNKLNRANERESGLKSDVAVLTTERDDLVQQLERKRNQIEQLSLRMIKRDSSGNNNTEDEVSRVKQRYQIIVENVQSQAQECQQRLDQLEGNTRRRVVISRTTNNDSGEDSGEDSYEDSEETASNDRASRVAEILKKSKANLARKRARNNANTKSDSDNNGNGATGNRNNRRTQTSTTRRTTTRLQVGQNLH